MPGTHSVVALLAGLAAFPLAGEAKVRVSLSSRLAQPRAPPAAAVAAAVEASAAVEAPRAGQAARPFSRTGYGASRRQLETADASGRRQLPETTPCSANPCTHGGFCTDNGVDAYSCMCRGIWSGTNCDEVDCLALFSAADTTCGEFICSNECKVAIYWAAGSQVAGGQTDGIDYCGTAGDSGGDFSIPIETYDPVFEITSPVAYTVGIGHIAGMQWGANCEDPCIYGTPDNPGIDPCSNGGECTGLIGDNWITAPDPPELGYSDYW